MSDIKVSVVSFADRRHLQMQYRDPVTGRKSTRSTGQTSKRLAEREAAKWEQELREGRYQPPGKITWEEFRKRYSDEHLPTLADTTASKAETVLDLFETCCKPERLRDVTAAQISYWQTNLRKRELSEHTIRGYMGHFRAALNWSVKIGLVPKAPKVQMPKRSRNKRMMRGRPITGEEFERMLQKVESVVGPTRAPSWTFLLNGLWWSGLRVGESLDLWWDRSDRLCVDMTGDRPVMFIPAELEKGNRDRLLAMAPEFANLLSTVPECDRSGRVFMPKAARSEASLNAVKRMIGEIGKAAGVKVSDENARSKGKPKYATAHDFRRSFGFRWSQRVMPAVLKELMRHESIETTMQFYVGHNAQATADVLWQAHANACGNTLGNSREFDPKSESVKSPQSPLQ